MTTTTRPKILIVDDNRNNRLSLRTILKGVDAELDEADNGFDALSLAMNDDYALILLDALMPVMDGFEVCERLRGNPRTAETPVIFLTAAYKDIQDNIRGYVAGATDYLAKPVDDHVLKAKVQVFLRLYTQQRALQEANAELRIAAIAFETQEGITVTTPEAVILRVNRAFSELTGYSAEEAIGKTPALLKSGRHDEAFYHHMWETLGREGYWQGEIWNRRKNGEIYPEWLTITAVLDPEGRTTHYVAVFSDITQRKEAEDQILQLAFYDPLTQLPNRRLLMDRLSQARLAGARSRNFSAMLFLDLDQFKTLNDTRGHDVGDLLLIEVAQRLNTCVREVDTVGRLGGDEFMVILRELGTNAAVAAANARTVGEKIRASLSRTYVLNRCECRITASIGICLFRGDDTSAEDLLKHADTAMYGAKNAGRNTLRFFDPEMQTALENRAVLECDLDQAIGLHQLQLYYQPQFDTARRLIGVEALLRWQHPSRGLVQPDQFVPLAEDTGQIVTIGLWVLETACRQAQRWVQQFALEPSFQLAVNISASQFLHPKFVEQVRHALAQTGLDPHRLRMELTERALLTDIEKASSQMMAIRELGVSFSIDNFGTSCSSLTSLKRLPLDQLKIDRSFVSEIARDSNSAILVQTIIGMSKNLGLQAMAEGVESEAQFERLTHYGCPAFQGFWFNRPATVADFTGLLERTNASQAGLIVQ